MKHPLLILGSIGGILVLGAVVWVYAFVFYVPAPETTRTADNPFVEVGGDAFGMVPEAQDADTATYAASGTPSAFHAPTLRRAAGAVMLETGAVRIVEIGTGHIYEIDATGSEHKISNTTFPKTRFAVWSPSGTSVALTREVDDTHTTFMGTLGTLPDGDPALVGTDILGVVHNSAWKDDTTLLYTIETPSGMRGVSRTLDTSTETTLFEIPLTTARVSWGSQPLIVTPATGGRLGYAYDTDLIRVTDSMEALTGIAAADSMVFAGMANGERISWALRDGTTALLDRAVMPEKCALQSSHAVCAVPKRIDDRTYPDAWYRGEESHDDTAVWFDLSTGAGTVLGDLSAVFNEPLDVQRALPTQAGALFISKDGRVVTIDAPTFTAPDDPLE